MGFCFFFRPPAYLFAKKRTLNNELTKGGLISVRGLSFVLSSSLIIDIVVVVVVVVVFII